MLHILDFILILKDSPFEQPFSLAFFALAFSRSGLFGPFRCFYSIGPVNEIICSADSGDHAYYSNLKT